MSTHHPVYKLRFTIPNLDPTSTQQIYHSAIYVETNQADHTGYIHHVTGSLSSPKGMHYERKPEDCSTHHDKTLIGYTLADSYLMLFDDVLMNVPTPRQQLAINCTNGRLEVFKTLNPLVFYGAGEERRKLFTCKEWMDEEAIPALVTAGLLVERVSAGDGRSGLKRA